MITITRIIALAVALLVSGSAFAQQYPNKPVKILIPSVIVSIAVGSLTGYTLSFWKVRGAGVLFGTLMVIAFVPYQIFIYPLVRVFSFVGLNNSIPGIVVVHTIFGLPTVPDVK